MYFFNQTIKSNWLWLVKFLSLFVFLFYWIFSATKWNTIEAHKYSYGSIRLRRTNYYLASGFGFQTWDCKMKIGFWETIGQRASYSSKNFVSAVTASQSVQRWPLMVLFRHCWGKYCWVFIRFRNWFTRWRWEWDWRKGLVDWWDLKVEALEGFGRV